MLIENYIDINYCIIERSNPQVTMSYLEIYNENIRDLLDPSSGYLELRDESGGRNIQVTSPDQLRAGDYFTSV